MDSLNFNIYMLNENLEEYESIIQFNELNDLNDSYETDVSMEISNQHPPSNNIITPWNPSKNLVIYTNLFNKLF